MRYLLTGLAYVVSLAMVAVAAFFFVIVLAGPHAGLLPKPVEVLIGIAGWVAVIFLPLGIGRWTWRRLNKA